jgi:FtsP/CotA-like multicopper oxidase with cupredoxin domain
MDGARDVTQAPIMPGQSFTYRFAAYPPGTHYYHSVRVHGSPRR